MIPKRGASQAPFEFVAPRTKPDTVDWKYRTNNTCLVNRYMEDHPAPKPATLTWEMTTPVSKSGTLIQDDGDGMHERMLSEMRKKRKHNPKG